MAYVTNSGSSTAMPYSANESYLQIAHPAVADVLLLQQMTDSGDGYKPPVLTGLPKALGRAASSSLILSSAYQHKYEWTDLAFVCSPAQCNLLELLAMTQTGAQPCTVVDNMQKTMLTKAVSIQLDGQYKIVYAGLNTLLVQFALSEV